MPRLFEVDVYLMSQGFPNSVERFGAILLARGIFLSGGGNLRSDFDHSNFFQRRKQYSVTIKRRLKLKLS